MVFVVAERRINAYLSLSELVVRSSTVKRPSGAKTSGPVLRFSDPGNATIRSLLGGVALRRPRRRATAHLFLPVLVHDTRTDARGPAPEPTSPVPTPAPTPALMTCQRSLDAGADARADARSVPVPRRTTRGRRERRGARVDGVRGARERTARRVPPEGELGVSVGGLVVSGMSHGDDAGFRHSASSIPDLHRAPTTRDPRVLPTSLSLLARLLSSHGSPPDLPGAARRRRRAHLP